PQKPIAATPTESEPFGISCIDGFTLPVDAASCRRRRFRRASAEPRMDFPVRPELDVTHVSAGPFEKPSGIGDLGAAEEPHGDMIAEGIDVAEGRIAYASGRMAVMQQLPDVVSAVAHDFEPAASDRTEFPGVIPHPDVDCRISLHRRREPQKS